MKTIQLTQSRVALVSDCDLQRCNSYGLWHVVRIRQHEYAATHVGSKRVFLHHFILSTTNEVDHKNGNGLDNRRSNIRQATRSQNNANRRVGRYPYKGIKSRSNERWSAQITIQRKETHLGYFDTPEEAAQAYDVAARKLFSNFARLNFP